MDKKQFLTYDEQITFLEEKKGSIPVCSISKKWEKKAASGKFSVCSNFIMYKYQRYGAANKKKAMQRQKNQLK